MTAITIQGRNCSAGMKPILACLPRILLTEMKSLSGSLSMVIRGVGSGEWGVGEGRGGEWGKGRGGEFDAYFLLFFVLFPHSPLPIPHPLSSAPALANEEGGSAAH